MKKNLNDYLKQIKTYSELKMFLKIIAQYGFWLHGKRRGYGAFDFRQVSWDKDKVDYLYNDGVSRGESYIKNLYRCLEVK